MNELLWRGIRFHLSSESHKGYERWDSDAEGPYGKALWVVDRYREEGKWYARLLAGVHRFGAQGPNPHLALDAALEEARKVRRQMSQAMPKDMP